MKKYHRQKVFSVPDWEIDGKFEDHPDADSDKNPSLGYQTATSMLAMAEKIRKIKSL